MDTIHIHGQWQWHDDACIVANKDGLLRLRDALNDAIQFGASGIGTFTSDGEGYHLLIIESDDIDKAAMPYHDASINCYEGVKFNDEGRFAKAYSNCRYAKKKSS